MRRIKRGRHKERCMAVRKVFCNDRGQRNSGIAVIYKLLRLCGVVLLFGSGFWAIPPGDHWVGGHQIVTAGF